MQLKVSLFHNVGVMPLLPHGRFLMSERKEEGAVDFVESLIEKSFSLLPYQPPSLSYYEASCMNEGTSAFLT